MTVYDYLAGLFTTTAPLVAGQVPGTTTNDNATAGNVGEYVSSGISVASNFPATTQFGDITSISLTAGDWDVSFNLEATLNAATMTEFAMFIGKVAGNNTTGAVNGDNFSESSAMPTAAADESLCVPAFRMSLSSTTTVYAKFRATYSAGQPKAYGRISARRVR